MVQMSQQSLCHDEPDADQNVLASLQMMADRYLLSVHLMVS
jgi:hypothetical protein